jgi:GFO/IDH/MocA oxidoreductase family protein
MARAKELIDEGRLGQLVAVMGSAVFFKPDEYFADGPWRREAGGGPILLNMVHEVPGTACRICALPRPSPKPRAGKIVDTTPA